MADRVRPANIPGGSIEEQPGVDGIRSAKHSIRSEGAQLLKALSITQHRGDSSARVGRPSSSQHLLQQLTHVNTCNSDTPYRGESWNSGGSRGFEWCSANAGTTDTVALVLIRVRISVLHLCISTLQIRISIRIAENLAKFWSAFIRRRKSSSVSMTHVLVQCRT